MMGIHPKAHFIRPSYAPFWLPYYFNQGKCFKGNVCSYAHSLTELKAIPNLLKTKICPHFLSGYCPNGASCSFAHGMNEMRKINGSKKEVCSYFLQGTCKFGDKCKFLHTIDNMKYNKQNSCLEVWNSSVEKPGMSLLEKHAMPLVKFPLHDEDYAAYFRVKNLGSDSSDATVSTVSPAYNMENSFFNNEFQSNSTVFSGPLYGYKQGFE